MIDAEFRDDERRHLRTVLGIFEDEHLSRLIDRSDHPAQRLRGVDNSQALRGQVGGIKQKPR